MAKLIAMNLCKPDNDIVISLAACIQMVKPQTRKFGCQDFHSPSTIDCKCNFVKDICLQLLYFVLQSVKTDLGNNSVTGRGACG